MSKKRMQYSTEFKVKIALAAIRGEEAVPLHSLSTPADKTKTQQHHVLILLF
ncbi:hypothetical protein SAMN05216419_100292 [Nitrosomonas cryotolerans]|uniref:Transposase n=1 Tax=Nitrosomonas cryotolerans ATCC 49181 TaxID=1131553 RepID=A0A1N6GVH7_9PROT|nr:hypothetical protein [Nitrosomonas cryotolerans]SFP41467.1 hypothetical protein SAMN05216419_100292 [Nitrosomonas cryotolerans]SIO11528.1 hypothetical protein SAMN02743940_0884 [Nitrosomonas cryotolerans ATCC 49181]